MKSVAKFEKSERNQRKRLGNVLNSQAGSRGCGEDSSTEGLKELKELKMEIGPRCSAVAHRVIVTGLLKQLNQDPL
jgi:hypothetical protein